MYGINVHHVCMYLYWASQQTSILIVTIENTYTHTHTYTITRSRRDYVPPHWRGTRQAPACANLTLTQTHHTILQYTFQSRATRRAIAFTRTKHFANSLLAGCTVPPESDSLITTSPVATVVREGGRLISCAISRVCACMCVFARRLLHLFVLSHHSRCVSVSAFGVHRCSHGRKLHMSNHTVKPDLYIGVVAWVRRFESFVVIVCDWFCVRFVRVFNLLWNRETSKNI